MAAIDATPRDLETVRAVLRRIVPGVEVRVFGSRVRGAARPVSDLDLAIMTDRPLPLETTASLREAFRDSDLPFKVDFVDWAATSERFRAVIEREGVVLQP